MRHFIHFDHERRLTARQIIRRANASKDAVNDADFCAFRRNKASHMRHQRDERDLTHVCAFTRHVRTRNDEHSVIIVIKKRAVWNKLILSVHACFHNRMTPINDINDTIFGDFRTNIVISNCGNRKRYQCVQRLKSDSGTLNTRNLIRKEVPNFNK